MMGRVDFLKCFWFWNQNFNKIKKSYYKCNIESYNNTHTNFQLAEAVEYTNCFSAEG